MCSWTRSARAALAAACALALVACGTPGELAPEPSTPSAMPTETATPTPTPTPTPEATEPVEPLVAPSFPPLPESRAEVQEIEVIGSPAESGTYDLYVVCGEGPLASWVATRGPQSRAAELAMMQQMIMFARAIVQMHRAMRDVRTATALQDGVASRLQAIYEQQPRPVAVAMGTSRGGAQDAPQEIPEHIRQAREGLATPARVRSPLPAKITPRPDVDEQQRRRPDKTNAPER